MSSFQSGLELGSSFINFVFSIVAGSIGFLLPFFAITFIAISIYSVYTVVSSHSLEKEADKDYAPGGPATK